MSRCLECWLKKYQQIDSFCLSRNLSHSCKFDIWKNLSCPAIISGSQSTNERLFLASNPPIPINTWWLNERSNAKLTPSSNFSEFLMAYPLAYDRFMKYIQTIYTEKNWVWIVFLYNCDTLVFPWKWSHQINLLHWGFRILTLFFKTPRGFQTDKNWNKG